MSKRKEEAIVYSQEMLTDGIYSLWIETSMASQAKAGQFIGVFTGDGTKLLARPISICDVKSDEKLLRMVYRVSGGGTDIISKLKKGDKVSVIGVLGNGYEKAACGYNEESSNCELIPLNKSLEGKKVIVIGGGIGIPPMLLAAKSLQCEKVMVLGYANKNTFLKDEFDKLGQVYISTDDGSLGTKGTVIDAIKENGVSGDVIFACGPMPMLRGIKAYAKEHDMKAYISLEERMACGVGACLGCVTKTVNKDHHTHVNNTRICVEGPVFDSEVVDI